MWNSKDPRDELRANVRSFELSPKQQSTLLSIQIVFETHTTSKRSARTYECICKLTGPYGQAFFTELFAGNYRIMAAERAAGVPSRAGRALIKTYLEIVGLYFDGTDKLIGWDSL